MQVVVTEEAASVSRSGAALNLEDMSDDEFFEFCVQNGDYRIERGADGLVTIVSGTGGRTGNRNLRLSAQLAMWADQDGRGFGFDSSTLFLLPNRAMRSPDAAWVSHPRLADIAEEHREKFLPVCPEFVVELTSPSDRLPAVKKKMAEWIENGCELGWIIETRARRVHIYRSSGVEVLDQPARLAGEGPVDGFTLELARIWDPGW